MSTPWGHKPDLAFFTRTWEEDRPEYPPILRRAMAERETAHSSVRIHIESMWEHIAIANLLGHPEGVAEGLEIALQAAELGVARLSTPWEWRDAQSVLCALVLAGDRDQADGFSRTLLQDGAIEDDPLNPDTAVTNQLLASLCLDDDAAAETHVATLQRLVNENALPVTSIADVTGIVDVARALLNRDDEAYQAAQHRDYATRVRLARRNPRNWVSLFSWIRSTLNVFAVRRGLQIADIPDTPLSLIHAAAQR